MIFTSGATLLASDPAWWAARGVTTGAAKDDYALANQGQLKKIAAEARNELNSFLTGGAGPNVDPLVNGWANTANADDYAILNLGQLKAVALPFYDRLIASGLAAGYPWTAATTDDDDYAPVNLGQLKYVFRFSRDNDEDGIDDLWELRVAGSLSVLNGPTDADGDGVTDLAEFVANTSPLNPAPAFVVVAPVGVALVP